ncbi:transposase [Nocardia gipuzkoensis]|uniref:transposase n=1 Tax=Nocardia gipuzkoensis TaxID=2749991 RepID=UPI001E5220B3|nr:transposase [Nocardia gipuzkoensis]UGT67857.1 transposase [Nocardia gipuzkoensis]
MVAALFVDSDVALSYRLLLGTYIGIVPDGIEALGVGDLDWAGDATILLDYLKGRNTTESVTLNRRSVRLLEQWLEHSTLTRRLAPPDTQPRLWTRYSPRYNRVTAEAFTFNQVTRWVQCRHPAVRKAGLSLVADDGSPLQIDRRRIRTTFLSLRDRKSWFGSPRAAVDPKPHTQGRGRQLPHRDHPRAARRGRGDHRKQPSGPVAQGRPAGTPALPPILVVNDYIHDPGCCHLDTSCTATGLTANPREAPAAPAPRQARSTPRAATTWPRRIFHGRKGEMTRTYYNGMEDQLEALGLVLNCVVLWNTVYMDRALSERRAQDYPVLDSDAARLSPFIRSHIGIDGHYGFHLPDLGGRHRPLRDPDCRDGE